MRTEELELWYQLLERMMFLAIRGTCVVANDPAPVLDETDCVLIRSDRRLPTEEIREALDAIDQASHRDADWEPLNRRVALRLAFRAYIARELWNMAFKMASVRERLEAQQSLDVAEAKRGFLVNLPGIVSDTFFTENADQFIEDWPLLVLKAGRNSAEEI